MSLCPHGININHRNCDRCEEIARAEIYATERYSRTAGGNADVHLLQDDMRADHEASERVKHQRDKLLAALKGLIENDDDVPGLYCPFREHWDYAVEAIKEADPTWVPPSV